MKKITIPFAIIAFIAGIALAALFFLLKEPIQQAVAPKATVVPESVTSAPEVDPNELLEEPDDEEEYERRVASNPMDFDIIRTYYGLLPYKLQDAYAMRGDQDRLSFKKFESWYENTKFARVRDEKYNSKAKSWTFLAEVIEDPYVYGIYEVEMSIGYGKIYTISSVPVEHREMHRASLSNSDGAVVVEFKNGIESVYHELDEDRVEIYSIDRNDQMNTFRSIHTLEVTPSDNFAIIQISQWEGGETIVLDLRTNEVAHTEFSSYPNGFTANEEWFVACQGSGMDAGYVRVYDVRDFSMRYSVEDEGIAECDYEKHGNIVTYTTIEYQEDYSYIKRDFAYDIVANALR